MAATSSNQPPRRLPLPLPMAGHLWSVVLLLAGSAAALAGERLAASARAPLAARTGLAAFGDIGSFVTPLESESAAPLGSTQLRVDPFGDIAASARIPVASRVRTPTVNARVARKLTAILIADDQPVAVIDGVVVNVGDVLPDGGRVAAIRSDRVAISERNGQMKVLTIPGGRR